MDSQQIYRYSTSCTGQSYIRLPQIYPPSNPEGLSGSSKFSSRNSPDSPLSSSIDCDTGVKLQSSVHNSLSGATASSSYSSPPSLDANGFNYFCHYSSPSSDCPRDSTSLASLSGSTQDVSFGSQSIKDALMELESALMDEDEVGGPTSYLGESGSKNLVPVQKSMVWNRASQGERNGGGRSLPSVSSCSSGSRNSGESERQTIQKRVSKQEPPSDGAPFSNLKQLLVECARALSENQLEEFDWLVGAARLMVSICGEPIQRLGAYMLEGLVARKESSGKIIYLSLWCKEPRGPDLLSYMHILYEVCPYLKFGYMAANGAIAEACRNEERVHIIDFQIAQGTQWMTLLQALAARPGGPPQVRITGIDDPVSKYARGDSLELVGKRLATMSEKFSIPVEFHAVPVFAPDVTREMLEVRPGEALAVNFPLQLHHTPDESVDVTNPRDGLLRMIKSLSPKVTTLVEQESNTNTSPFLTRFIETLDYYSAMFESIDVTMPRHQKERINVEQHCLAKDIVNVIACEGKERVERHELLGKWRSRFMMAGFRPLQLSPYVNSVIGGLLRCYSEQYTLVEKDGALLLGWKSRMLVSASAWR